MCGERAWVWTTRHSAGAKFGLFALNFTAAVAGDLNVASGENLPRDTRA